MIFTPQLTYILSWQDLYLSPLYILLIFYFVKKWKKYYYNDSPIKKYIFPALIFRMTGSIFLALVFNFYYGYGDTFSYYTGAHEIWMAFKESPGIAWEIIANHPRNYSQQALEFANHSGYTGFALSHYAMMKIAGVTGLLGFGSYMPIALIFSLLSFWGTWMIFLVFYEAFPHLYKPIAITTLFIPTIMVWTNGILKEPVCTFALGLCFYTVNNIFKGRSIIKNSFLLLIGSVILLKVKDYILYIFLIAICFWAYKTFINYISSVFTRRVIKFFIYFFLAVGIVYFFLNDSNFVQEAFTSYFKKAENLQTVMVTINRDYNSGSGYTLPTSDFSSAGLVRGFLVALNVALFRPYLWECNNPLMVLSFLESFAATLFVLFILFKAGPAKIVKSFHHPLLLYSLMFSLMMAALVGFISFNFGTLIRYKTPFEPFFYTMLVIIAFNNQPLVSTSKPVES